MPVTGEEPAKECKVSGKFFVAPVPLLGFRLSLLRTAVVEFRSGADVGELALGGAIAGGFFIEVLAGILAISSNQGIAILTQPVGA